MYLPSISSTGDTSSVIYMFRKTKNSHCALVQYKSKALIPPLNKASNNRRKESADSPHLSQPSAPISLWSGARLLARCLPIEQLPRDTSKIQTTYNSQRLGIRNQSLQLRIIILYIANRDRRWTCMYSGHPCFVSSLVIKKKTHTHRVLVAPMLSWFHYYRYSLKQDNIYLVQCTIRFILTAKLVSHRPRYSYGDLCINYRKIPSVPWRIRRTLTYGWRWPTQTNKT